MGRGLGYNSAVLLSEPTIRTDTTMEEAHADF
jgi:hypothetical protein